MNRINITYKDKLSKKNKSACFKWTYAISGNDDRVATLPNRT